jgi:hypothetical protein
MPPKSFQIQLSDGEKNNLVNRIELDFATDKSSHLSWSTRCAGWMKKWEARVEAPRAGDEDKPNHVVPLIQWQCFNKLAREIQALLGDNAEITARGTGPSDKKVVAKVGAYMTSRVFDQMQLINPLCEFEFRRILNGWAAAYRPWWRREFDTLQNGKIKRVCDYEGPGFFPLEPDDLMVPPERGVKSLQEFSHVIRRVRVTVDDLQRGDGTLYQGTSDPDMVTKLINWANIGGQGNDYTMDGQDPVREERERSEGVDYSAYSLGRRSIWMWEWYGYWRPLKKQTRDGAIDDLEKRLLYEADYVVKFIPGLREIVGCQDLLQLYPKMRRRRPFVESTLIKDGTYRPKGFGALLEDLEDELTANSRHFQAAGELSVWPIIFYKPGGGMKPGITELEAGKAYPTEDPASVNVIKITPNLDFLMARQQDLITIAERVTNINDQSMGRSMTQPNAPKTATGQLALIEEGNVRAYLDSTILREDTEEIVGDFWDLDCDLVPKTEPGLFFRVTEEQANGLFDVSKGGAHMTPKEFGGVYDFRLKFATSVWARNAKKQDFVAFYGAAMQNPLCMQNPTAMWHLLNMLAKQFDIDFQDVIPKPPEPDQPKTPDQEWTEMLEGETVNVNPQDNDDLHIQQHIQQLEDERQDPERDVQAIGMMVQHVQDHQQQKRTKMLMQTLTSQLMQSIQPPPQSPAQQTIQQLQQMYGGGPQAGQNSMGGDFANYLANNPQQQQQQQPGPPQGMPPQQPGMGAPPQFGASGDVQAPPQGVGSQAAPQSVDGQL